MRRIFIILIFLIATVLANPAFSQSSNDDVNRLNAKILELQQQIAEMQKRHAAEIAALKKQIEEIATLTAEQKTAEDLEALRALAKAKMAETTIAEEEGEETVFKSLGLGLQALNPEISVTGDFLFSSRQDSTREETSDFDFRTLGIHIESWLDPYTRFKSAIAVNEDDAKLGEAYITLHEIADDLNLTLGKFRQQFGVVNRWHKHGLDQVDFPVALRQIFGEGGLNQSGVSLDWMMPPAGEVSQQLTLQVTDGDNGRVFGDNSSNRPSILLHYKNFRDLSKDTYLECGLTGLLGWNDAWELADGSTRNDRRTTTVFGADLSVLWEPTDKMRYRNVEWRSEAYLLNKEIVASDGSGKDSIDAWGLYSYLQSKISRTVDIGIRFDFFVPDTKGYADVPGFSLSPLAVTGENPYLWQVSPYITWWQSPFVKFRVEYDHADGKGIDYPEDIIWLQAIFSAGPHKHERY